MVRQLGLEASLPPGLLPEGSLSGQDWTGYVRQSGRSRRSPWEPLPWPGRPKEDRESQRAPTTFYPLIRKGVSRAQVGVKDDRENVVTVEAPCPRGGPH